MGNAGRIKELGRGGFARVELWAEDGWPFARKIFDPDLDAQAVSTKENLLARFEREAKYQSELGDDICVPVYRMDFSSKEPWYDMPYAEEVFDDKIREMRSDGYHDLSALLQILERLRKLHELGFIHRDLKPSNILRLQNKWLLGDFGLIKPPSGLTTDLTKISVFGSAAYSPPEFYSNFQGVCNRADIYSFGCILHDIFATDPRDRAPFSQVTVDNRPSISAVVSKCTERDPKKRYQSADELGAALIRAIEVSDNSPSSMTDWPARIVAFVEWDREEKLRFLDHIQSPECEPRSLGAIGHLELRSLFEEFPDRAPTVGDKYCDFVDDTEFGWEMSDYVGLTLMVIFEKSELGLKMKAFHSLFQLACRNNRFYLMDRVFDILNYAQLDQNLRKRLKIEIAVHELAERLRSFKDVARTFLQPGAEQMLER